MSQPLMTFCVQPGRTATRLLLACGLIRIALGVSAARAGDPPIKPRLPRENLLEYRGPDGVRKPVATIDDWLERRKEILGGMQSVMGRLPGPEKHCPLDVRVEEETDCG